MRYDTPIFFLSRITGVFDYQTGNYKDDSYVEVQKMASVMGMNPQTAKLLYGDIKQDVKVAHIQNHYYEPFDYIRIGKTRYKADQQRNLRNKTTFYLIEVV